MNNLFNLTSALEGEPYEVLLPLGLILLLAKVFSLLMGRIKIPQVVGYLLAGLAVGCIFLIPKQGVLTEYTVNGINEVGKIGVILILFEAGLTTDLKKIKANGLSSILITIAGVVIPLLLGWGVSYLIGPGKSIYTHIYYGVILTATSVSITVAALKEMGKLDSKVGTALVSAAILDDIIGVIVLSVIITLSGSGSTTEYVRGNDILNLVIMIGLMIVFFAMSVLLGIGLHKLFDWMGKKWPNHRRIPVFSLAFCFIWSYLAEKVFHVADITGAYIAGLELANTSAAHYIDSKTDSTANLIFVPAFFASVALKMFTSFQSGTSFTPSFVLFGCMWILVGLIGKVFGAGFAAKICGFGWRDSNAIGIGMMARAEVLIVTAQKGVDAGLVSPSIIPFTLVLIVISSFLTPIILRLIYKKDGIIKEIARRHEEEQRKIKEN